MMLKMRCKQCNSRNLLVLHDTAMKGTGSSQAVPNEAATDQTNSCLLNTMNEILLIRKPPANRKVLLKISQVIIRNGKQCMTAYAIQDDGSEITILLHSAAQQLGLKGKPEELPLRTVRQELQVLSGATVSFSISPLSQPKRVFQIKEAFTAQQLSLAEHTHPVKLLMKKYQHLRGLPLQNLETVSPVLLIGSDYPYLVTPVEPVCLSPPGVLPPLRHALAGHYRALCNNYNMRLGNNLVTSHQLQPQRSTSLSMWNNCGRWMCFHGAVKRPAPDLSRIMRR